MSKIVKLSSENVKRLVAVEISPQGNVVVVGGANGAGKSSVLDSIEFALGGDPSAKMPVRRGEEKARIVVDLGDIVVRRTFTAAGGTSLIVTDADGKKQSTPQAILDKLVGKLTFDPLQFAREKPKTQAEILRGLVGLDFAAHDAEREKVFDERTTVNREAKELQARIAGIPKHEGLPEKEESTADILEQQRKAADKNAANKTYRDNVATCEGRVLNIKSDIKSQSDLIDDLTKQLNEAARVLVKLEADLVQREKQFESAKADAKDLVDVDLTQFATRAASVEDSNRKVRQAKQRAELVAQLRAKTEESEKLTDKLDKLDGTKRKAAMDAKYPVDGLAFDTAGGVTFNGIPFDQCSSAEQLKVSVAIGIALNPKLRVLLIRDGSLLDDDSMKVLAKMAGDAQVQVWVERVSVDATTSVVIEDGHVKAPSADSPLEHNEMTAPAPAKDKPTKEGQLL